MKAMVLRAPAPIGARPLRLEDVPCGEPGAGAVRLRVTACGACRTDLHLAEGDLPLPAGRAVIPGHQVVGRIDAVGVGVAPSRLGERVGLAWLQGTCGSCEPCGEGRENLCESPRFTGWTEPGGYAERVVAPADWTWTLPPSLDDLDATPLLCAGIIGYRALRLSGARPGDRLGLHGFGNSAHVTIQVALARGMEVHVFSHREEHRALAREMGAAWAGGPDEAPRRPCHAAILFAPAGELVPKALRTLRRGGTLALAGIHLSAIPPLDYRRDLFFERTLRSVTANTRQDAREFLAEAERIGIRTRVKAYDLAEANEALADLAAGRISGAAALRVG